MKKVFAVSALLSMVGTASFACTVEESRALSDAISTMTEKAVAMDSANLGRVMALTQEAAVIEYHAGPSSTSCERKAQILDSLEELTDALSAEESAMLK